VVTNRGDNGGGSYTQVIHSVHGYPQVIHNGGVTYPQVIHRISTGYTHSIQRLSTQLSTEKTTIIEVFKGA